MAANPRLRFMDNNVAEAGSITASSTLSGTSASNLFNDNRYKAWKPSGQFLIDSTNQELYINDGGDVTVSITNGSYATPAALATQIQTDLNAASSNWTVAYDLSGGTYKFTISNTGSVTLRYSQTTNAIWDTLGYTGAGDTTATSFVADEQRNHTEEYLVIDMGTAQQMEFFALLGPSGEPFQVNSSATIKLQANGVDSWASPPLDLTLTWDDQGIMRFFDDQSSLPSYRFWRVYVQDKQNALGPQGVSYSHLYLGTYETITLRGMSNGFIKKVIDPSSEFISSGGARFYNQRTQYLEISSLGLNFLEATERRNLEQMSYNLGKTNSFYLSLDPTLCASTELQELTRYVRFTDTPVFAHVKSDIYSMRFSVREVI